MPHLVAQAAATPHSRRVAKGKLIYCIGQEGSAWQILHGSIRLNFFHNEELILAGVAVAGDVIGVEALLAGHYDFEAIAMTDCLIATWHPAEPRGLLKLLAAQTQRNASALTLRVGTAEERVRQFLALLAAGQGRYADPETIHLPSLRNIGEITGLTIETVSRVLSRWRSLGLVSHRSRGSLHLALPFLSAPFSPEIRQAS